MADQAPLLHHHRDRLSERRRRISATPTRRSRPTRSRASCGSTATTCFSSPAPTSTAMKMQQTAAREGLTPRELVERNVPRFQAMVERHELLERRLHPHHRGAPSSRVGRDLGADGGSGRHLSRQICRLVLGARRSLLRRGRDQARRQRRARRPARHAGRMGGGGELFLPAVGLSGQAARSLCAASRLRAAEGAAQRGRELRARAACRTSRSRAPPSTGASGCRATPSTSCMCGSTR